MSRILILSLSSLFLSCAVIPDTIHYYTNGITILDETNNGIDIDKAYKMVLCYAEEYNIKSMHLHISFINDEFLGKQGKYYCRAHQIKVAYWNKYDRFNSRWEEALEHELKHWVLDVTTGNCDASHKSNIWQQTLICLED
jgi:hypothetical protein